MCSNDDIKAKVEEFQRANIVEHKQIAENFNNVISALEDSLTTRHIELANQIKDTTKEMSLAAKEVSLAAQAAQTATQGAKAATGTSKLYKGLFTLSLLVIGGLFGFTGVAYNGMKNAEIEKTQSIQKQNVILDSMKTVIKESAAVQKNINTKALMDTINIHWIKENEFYRNEFKPQVSWTKDIRNKEILPAYKTSKKNEMLIKGHEYRIQKLEGRLD